MGSILAFKAPQAQVAVYATVDGSLLLWMSLNELREWILQLKARTPSDSDLGHRVVVAIAAGLLASDKTDAEVKTYGWASLETMQQRGRDMLDVAYEVRARK